MTAIAVLVATATSALVAAAMVQLGPFSGFVDYPDSGLKTHARPVPVLGGVAVVAGALAAARIADALTWALAVPTLAMLTLGMVDDRVGLTPRSRLLIEMGVGAGFAIMLAFQQGLAPIAAFAVPLLVVVAVNAINLFDGMDGLVGATGAVTGLGLWLLTLSRDGSDPIGMLMAGALVGFLAWHWPPAKLFLGDGGAYAVGLVVVYSAVVGSASGALDEVVIGFGMLGVVIIDLAVTFLRRVSSGQALFSGDRAHLYDQMAKRSASTRAVVAKLLVWQVVIVGLLLLIDRITTPWLTLALSAIVGALALILIYRLGYLSTGVGGGSIEGGD